MDEKQRKYARFLLQRCVRLKKGTPLAIPYITSQKEFVQILKEEALKLGASDVYLMESDGDKTRKILEESTIEEIKANTYFDRNKLDEAYKQGGCVIWPDSYEPPHLNGVDEEKRKAMNSVKIKTQKESLPARRKYQFPSCIAAVATKPWAEALFPNDTNGYEKLWDLIFKITMMDRKDPFEAWEKQIEKNTKRKKLLNDLNLVKLKYKNSLGTNFEVGLPKDVIWQGTSKVGFEGAEDTIVNFPTYENFTSPNKNEVNGTIVSSVPLFLRGNKIENIKLKFENGRLIDAKADANEDTLLNVINEYDGMHYLGECALVDFHSPISEIDINFITILIEENKRCHIALGGSFVRTIPNGDKMADEELSKAGLNICPNHIDIMIGTEDLSIIGTDIYGNEVPIFINGDFAEEKIIEFIKNREAV